MSKQDALAGRVNRFRALMAERGYNAAIVRNLPDLRWLMGCERAFDDERAHVAFITPDGLWLHTDSRYFGTFKTKLGENTPWQLDQDLIDGASWAAAKVAELHPQVVAIEDSWSLGFYERFCQELSAKSVAPALPRMHDDIAELLRVSKDEEELELMRKAQEITDAGFAHICTYIKAGMTEMQIKTELESFMFAHGATGLAFESIIAAGPNGANPHARASEYVVKEGDAIVMDFGASYNDYCSDMTRTVCVGEPSEELKKVYNIVLHTNQVCGEAITAGVIGSDIQALAVKTISDAGYGDYFKHGLGHGVGIQIHEKPGCGRSYHKELPAGSVVTDEPGIYLPGKFGVRIEDCGVVTNKGYQRFTQSPHEMVTVGL